MKIADELFAIADRLKVRAERLDDDKISKPLQHLEERAKNVRKAWSGSWFGYHSRVYYADLAEPPPGAHFSQEWGLKEQVFVRETVGDWKEFRFDDVLSSIQNGVSTKTMNRIKSSCISTNADFDEEKSRLSSILSGLCRTQKMKGISPTLLRKLKTLRCSTRTTSFKQCAQQERLCRGIR